MSDTSSFADESGDEEPMAVLFQVTALVDWTAPNNLKFRTGDRIGVTNDDDELWWHGCVLDPSDGYPVSGVGDFPIKYSGGEPLVTMPGDAEGDDPRPSWPEPEPEPQPEPQPEPELEPEPELYYYEGPDGENVPVTAGELRALVRGGDVESSTRIWAESLGEAWVPLGDAVKLDKDLIDVLSLEGTMARPEGILEKKDRSWPRRWKERYFILHADGWLAYWESKHAADSAEPPKGRVYIDKTTEFQPLPDERGFGFLVTAHESRSATSDGGGDGRRRPLTLHTDTQTKFDQWFGGIFEHVDRAVRGDQFFALSGDYPVDLGADELQELAAWRARCRAEKTISPLNFAKPTATRSSSSQLRLVPAPELPPADAGVEVHIGADDDSEDDELTHTWSVEHIAAFARIRAEQKAEEEKWRAEEARRSAQLVRTQTNEADDELERTLSQIQAYEDAQQQQQQQQRRQRQQQQLLREQRERDEFIARCRTEGLRDDDITKLEQGGITRVEQFPRDAVVGVLSIHT